MDEQRVAKQAAARAVARVALRVDPRAAQWAEWMVVQMVGMSVA